MVRSRTVAYGDGCTIVDSQFVAVMFSMSQKQFLLQNLFHHVYSRCEFERKISSEETLNSLGTAAEVVKAE